MRPWVAVASTDDRGEQPSSAGDTPPGAAPPPSGEGAQGEVPQSPPAPEPPSGPSSPPDGEPPRDETPAEPADVPPDAPTRTWQPPAGEQPPSRDPAPAAPATGQPAVPAEPAPQTPGATGGVPTGPAGSIEQPAAGDETTRVHEAIAGPVTNPGADAPTRAHQGFPQPPAAGAAAGGPPSPDDPDAPTPPSGMPRTAQFPPAWPPQPGQPGRPGQWPPQGPPPQQPARSGGTWKKVVALVVALALLIAAGGVGWFLYDRAQRTVALLAADEAGGDAFTPNLVQSGSLAPTTKFDAAANRTPAGNLDGLYLDQTGTSGCNRDQLLTTLQADPALAGAWATAVGTTAQALPEYVGTLTPVRLRADTRLTSHSWSGGTAEPYAAVLQAGSAVLVDDRGMPRVHCADGAPLTGAQAVEEPYYGSAWDGFDPNTLVEVRPAGAAVAEFGLVDTAGEQPFRRPAGTTGDKDVAALPETGRLNGAYVLTGASTRCEGLQNCQASALLTVSPRFAGCPESCTVSERGFGDNVALTREGSVWKAAGNAPENASYLCNGRPSTTQYTVNFTPTRSQVVNGVWTATSVKADYERRAPAEAGCVPVQVAWTVNGVGG